jgi:hypothetical protein
MRNPLVNPRISLIACISNFGELFYSISQGNTNMITFKLFMAHIARMLDTKKPDWKSNTII